MRYEILGPLRVVDGCTVRFTTSRKIETLLAVLLLRADQVVTRDQLIAEIWGDNPPRRATAGLHVYVSQLRKFLDPSSGDLNPVATCWPGYVLHIGEDELDLLDFLRLIEQGKARIRDERPEDAAARLESALALWRGPVLGDLQRGPILEGAEPWLTENRMECLELLLDTQLMMGRHRELIGQLYSLTAENPLREAFYHRLMLALYRSHRTADALSVFQAARAVLRDELGIEPCRKLRELHSAILKADDQLHYSPEFCGVPNGTTSPHSALEGGPARGVLRELNVPHLPRQLPGGAWLRTRPATS